MLSESHEDPEYNKVDIVPYLKYLLQMLLHYKSEGSIEHSYEMNIGSVGDGHKGHEGHERSDQMSSGLYALQETDLESYTNGSAIRVSNGSDDAKGGTLELFKVGTHTDADAPSIDTASDVLARKTVKSSRKVFNTSSKVYNSIDVSSGVIENNPSIRKVVNRNSSSSFSVPNSETGYSTSDKIQADTDWRAENMQDVNSTDDVSWSAPTKNVAKKTWFG